MLPCWRLDVLYECGHQPYRELAIEITGLHINDPKWPAFMTAWLCQNQELIELASYFKPGPDAP